MSLWHLVHDISKDIAQSVSNTTLHGSATPIETPTSTIAATQFEFTQSTSLAAARRNAPLNLVQKTGPIATHTGLLMQTSRQPGSDFTEGSSTFEAVMARSTSIIASLTTSAAGQQFYHNYDPLSALYSPQVVGVRRAEGDTLDCAEPDFDPRRDAIPADPTTSTLQSPFIPSNTSPYRTVGDYVSPYPINVLSIPYMRWSTSDTTNSRRTLRSRLSFALDAFALHRDRTIVLRPDPGVPIAETAQIYAELLACAPSDCGAGRFRNVFEKVIFCLNHSSLKDFKDAFELRLFEDELNASLSE